MSGELLIDIDTDTILDDLRTGGVLEIPEANGQSELAKTQDGNNDKADTEGKPNEEEKSAQAASSGETRVAEVKPDVDASGVDQSPLDKKTGLNKFRDLERQRDEERRHHQKELEEEKERRSAYTGKKWKLTTSAGPVRPQEAGGLADNAVKPSSTKRSAREEIEEQTRRAREKALLEQGATAASTSAAEPSSDVPAAESASLDELGVTLSVRDGGPPLLLPQDEGATSAPEPASVVVSGGAKPEDATDSASQQGAETEPQAGQGDAPQENVADAGAPKEEEARPASDAAPGEGAARRSVNREASACTKSSR